MDAPNGEGIEKGFRSAWEARSRGGSGESDESMYGIEAIQPARGDTFSL
jgi:hypothetical protein